MHDIVLHHTKYCVWIKLAQTSTKNNSYWIYWSYYMPEITLDIRNNKLFGEQTISTFWGQVQFLFFFPIAALWNSWKWNVIQQIKNVSWWTLFHPGYLSTEKREKHIFFFKLKSVKLFYFCHLWLAKFGIHPMCKMHAGGWLFKTKWKYRYSGPRLARPLFTRTTA